MEDSIDVSEREVPSLPADLHAATRTEHLALNRAILSRLPLCLPPHASDALLYAKGMTVLAQIYFGLESAWDTLLLSPRTRGPLPAALSQLRMRSLSRTVRLQKDINMMRNTLQSRCLKELDILHQQSILFREKIEATIESKPHLILAYAWTMYLALFNGGRFIRKQLVDAGPDFWACPVPESDREKQSDVECLSFWYFEGDQDGEDIKDSFKLKFAAAAELLSAEERRDEIAEAKAIFRTCAEMVELLDASAAAVPTDTQAQVPVPAAWTSAPYSSGYSLLASWWSSVSSTCTAWVKPGSSGIGREEVHAEGA